MELLQHISEKLVKLDYAAPACVARYSPVFWEPLAGTGERIVALVALEPDESSQTQLSAGTYCVLPVERLRAMLGRQRGNASYGVLRQVADYMTARQQAGLPVSELDSPFHGFALGPTYRARGYSVEQLLDAAVRSITAFGNADDLIDEEDSREKPRHTIKTSEFLAVLKRQVAGEDSDMKARFEKALRPSADLPDLTVDYAFNQWLLQVTSLPATKRQAVNAQRESQSKLYEIDMIRRHMQGNAVHPVLLINSDVLTSSTSEEALNEARSMQDRLSRLAKSEGLDLIEASSAYEAATYVLALT